MIVYKAESALDRNINVKSHQFLPSLMTCHHALPKNNPSDIHTQLKDRDSSH